MAYNSTLFGQYNCDWTWFLRSPEQLGKVIERLLQAKLKLKAIKCKFFPKNWHFWDMLHRKMVLKLTQWKLKLSSIGNQQNMSGLWSFLGLVKYYRKFSKNFVEKAKCLHALTSTNAKWKRTDKCQNTFQTLKFKQVTAPILGYADTDVGVFILDILATLQPELLCHRFKMARRYM